jgi:hypothetical protein
VSKLAKASDFGGALETLFRELGTEWLSAAPASRVVTDERVLRELSLPPDAQTRLCYFALPVRLVSLYRELVFPAVNDVGLVPASGDEVSGAEGNIRAVVESLLQRAYVVVADVSTADSRVLRDVHAAAQRERRPLIAVVAEEGQGIESAMPKAAKLFTRPPASASDSLGSSDRHTGESEPWLDALTDWLGEVAAGASGRLEEEALRLLQQGMFRAAVIAASSALEVALAERLDEREATPRGEYRPRRPASPMGRLLTTAMVMELITAEEYEDLRELQRARNLLVHTAEPIDGRRARGLVQRAAKVVSRLPRSTT